VEKFASPQFDVSKALHEFNKDRLQNATTCLNIILKWARLMHEKLWTKCAEFYLLGLAYKSWRQSAESDPGSYSSMSRLQYLKDLYQELQTVADIELSDSEDEVSEDDHLTHIFQTSAADTNIPQDGESLADVKHPEIADQIGGSAEEASQRRSLVIGTGDSLCNGEKAFLRTCRREILNELKYRYLQNHRQNEDEANLTSIESRAAATFG
jgi:hypothetical protein